MKLRHLVETLPGILNPTVGAAVDAHEGLQEVVEVSLLSLVPRNHHDLDRRQSLVHRSHP